MALAARFDALIPVVVGTTLGMMLANVPAVYLGKRAATAVNLKVVHGIAAIIFVVLGVATLMGAGTAVGL